VVGNQPTNRPQTLKKKLEVEAKYTAWSERSVVLLKKKRDGRTTARATGHGGE
jgi:hypothetical protein